MILNLVDLVGSLKLYFWVKNLDLFILFDVGLFKLVLFELECLII